MIGAVMYVLKQPIPFWLFLINFISLLIVTISIENMIDDLKTKNDKIANRTFEMNDQLYYVSRELLKVQEWIDKKEEGE